MVHICYFPIVKTESQLIDILSRAAWFLGHCSIDLISIPVKSDKLSKMHWQVAPGMDAQIKIKLQQIIKKIKYIVTESEDDIFKNRPETSIILKWKKDLQPDSTSRDALLNWQEGKKVWEVDPNQDRMEGGNYIAADLFLTNNKNKTIKDNLIKFNELSNRLGTFKKAYLLATGPSVSEYKDHDFKNAITIACNSIVLDHDLMTAAKPQIITFADPIFHFGPSEYAAEFRKKLIEASKIFDFEICIPFKYYPLFTAGMPELKHRTIGIPFRQDIHYNYDLNNNFILKTTANILTFLMLPLASTFSKNINFLGFDGRPLSDNDYFWKHNPKTQINEKMKNIQEIHPGFFKIDYNDYYSQHCNILEEMLFQGEKMGYTFSSLAFSYTPALKKRSKINDSTNLLSNETPSHKSKIHYPKLLIIDSTPIGSLSATGQFKQTFLGDWPRDKVLQVYLTFYHDKPSLQLYRLNDNFNKSAQASCLSKKEILEACIEFLPDIIYFRPIESSVLIDFAISAVSAIKQPLITHIMDDWQERMRCQKPELFTEMDKKLRKILESSKKCLSICDAMSIEYKTRYGYEFIPMANGVDIHDYPGKKWDDRPPLSKENPFIIRYTGALTDDMGFQSIYDIVECINEIKNTIPVKFEIYTMKWCMKKAQTSLGSFSNVSIFESVSDLKNYRSLLQTADMLILTYNFDKDSVRYIHLSMANKMPEYLASGVPLLAYGPGSVETINYLKKTGVARVINKRNIARLKKEIIYLATNFKECDYLAKKAKDFVAKHHCQSDIQQKFYNLTYYSSLQSKKTEPILKGPYSSAEAAHYDETDAIAQLFANTLKGSTMIDVGAHHGSALMPFLNMNWDIYAFEPDKNNSEVLQKRLKKHQHHKKVTIDFHAISNTSVKDIPFFSSEESTGVSGLSAFLPSHKTDQQVDTTTLTEALKDKKIKAVDFLKIDTEGHDLFVLQGFPWDRFKPAVIECEFEDLKTVPLGYTFKDLALFLTDKGYKVYVSEWHPIVRYGIRHNWKRLTRYPYELSNKKAWGNLLAFRDPVDDSIVVDAVSNQLKFHRAGTKATDTSLIQSANHDHNNFKFNGIIYSGDVSCNNNNYNLSCPASDNWVACRYKGEVRPSEIIKGTLNLHTDTKCRLKLVLCRDGSTAFEKTEKTFTLSKGRHSLSLSHQFKNNQQGVRIQVGTEDNDTIIKDLTSGLIHLPKQENISVSEAPADNNNSKRHNPSLLPGMPNLKKINFDHILRTSLFLIGNGSSLRSMDFQRLKKVKSIGMNAAYRHWQTTNIYPDYYICLDTIVIESLKTEIYELIQNRVNNDIQLFFLRKNMLHFYPELEKVPEVVFYEDYLSSPYFEGITQGITTGSFTALLGAMLGYKQIYLLGIDINYIQQIPEAKNIKGNVLEMTRTPLNNPNYFFNDYQRKGDRFNIPDSKPELHYKSWIMVKDRLKDFGVHVLNCNPDSKLDIFDYADINKVLSS